MRFHRFPVERVPQLLVEGATAYVYGLGGAPLEKIDGPTVLYYHQAMNQESRRATTLTLDMPGFGQLRVAAERGRVGRRSDVRRR